MDDGCTKMFDVGYGEVVGRRRLHMRGDKVELHADAVTMDSRGLMRDYNKVPMLAELILKTKIDQYRARKSGTPLEPERMPEQFNIDTPGTNGVLPMDARVLLLHHSRIGRCLRLWGDVAEAIQEVACDEWPVTGRCTVVG